MARALRFLPLLALLLAAPLWAADLWTYGHEKPTFTIGVPNGWEETVVASRAGSRLLASLRDPLTREKPVPSRLDLYALRLPPRGGPAELTEEALRIGAYKPVPLETYRFLERKELEVNGFPAILVLGEVTTAGGAAARRVEMSYRGVRYLYAAVYTVPAGDYSWLEGRIRASLESFRGRDVPRNPTTAWLFGGGGLALLAILLVFIHRWYRS
jgi:hypothetical protein